MEIMRDRMLIVKKGRGWEAGRTIGNVLAEMEIEGDWSEERCGEGGDTTKVLFEKKEDRDRLWKRKDRLRREESFLVDEWLSFEERKERNRMVEDKREIEELARRKGFKLEMKVENRKIKVGKFWYERRGKSYRKVRGEESGADQEEEESE